MLTLFHDYTSPASAVAVLRLQRLADEGLPVAFAGFEAIGVDAHLPVTLDVLAALEDLSGAAAAEGLALHRPPALPPTAPAHLVGGLAEAVGLGASWRDVCYRALWEQGSDIADARVLTRLAGVAGLDPDTVRAALTAPGGVATVRRRMAAHRGDGVGGVPTLLAQRTLVPGLLDEGDLRTLAVLG
jgi:predicted DsbA family dithiol-disulfide isomerase